MTYVQNDVRHAAQKAQMTPKEMTENRVTLTDETDGDTIYLRLSSAGWMWAEWSRGRFVAEGDPKWRRKYPWPAEARDLEGLLKLGVPAYPTPAAAIRGIRRLGKVYI